MARPRHRKEGIMRILVLVLAAGAAGVANGASVEHAIIAAMQLSEARSYSWRCSVTDDAQSYDIEGRKREDGYTWQRQPMPKSIARRLGRGADDRLEAIFKSTHQYVIATEQGWRTLPELPKEHKDWNDDQWFYVSVPVVRTPEMPADANDAGTFGLPPVIYVPVLRQSAEKDSSRVYSNAQFALALPDQELSVIVSCHTALTVEENVAAGELNDLGAQLLLVHDGHEYIRPVVATGRFKLWLHNGTVNKYVVELAGIVVVDRKPIYVRQKSTTELKDVGATTFLLPVDALDRLAQR
jgi:hypothetical protein